MKMQISKIHQETAIVKTFLLHSPDGTPLPAWEAGAHIDIHLPDGMIRQYSLCTNNNTPHAYRIAVKLEPNSRGGSQAMHQLQEGDELEVSPPLNHFELAQDVDKHILIAAVIGIAPIYAMAQQLAQHNQDFELLYVASSASEAALLSEVHKMCGPRIHEFFGENLREQQAEVLRTLLAPATPKTHVYICGPVEFNHKAESIAAENLSATQIHIENFRADPDLLHSPAGNTVFEVVFQGETFVIPADQSIVDVFEDNDVGILTSCAEGTCGTCTMRVVAGIPDHRDSVLSTQQHEDEQLFTPCCSRARSERITLERWRRQAPAAPVETPEGVKKLFKRWGSA
ncbi:PDR/VanB family oxidoreductase [Corynebacterium callunae]|uniref:PDR/VanB family oxidoreductase n=1 Tax=Corynebacterium callunae TaxID=1721 RepID=UPI003982B3DA